MDRLHIEFWNCAIYALRIQCIAFIECQKAEGFRLYSIAGQQDAILSIRDPGSSPCFRFLLVKSKLLDFYQRHDFTEKLSDHLRDDLRIIRPGMINTKWH